MHNVSPGLLPPTFLPLLLQGHAPHRLPASRIGFPYAAYYVQSLRPREFETLALVEPCLYRLCILPGRPPQCEIRRLLLAGQVQSPERENVVVDITSYTIAAVQGSPHRIAVYE